MNTLPPSRNAPLGAPPGPPEATLEVFANDGALAKRIAVPLREVRRLIRSGELRPKKVGHDRTFYATDDLDRLRGDGIQEILRQVSRLTPGERQVAFFARLTARESGRTEPNEDDRREGTRRAQAAQQFDAQADRTVARIDAVLSRLDGLAANRGGLRFRLSAATIDAPAGIIRGVTVAKSGVTAVGKFVYLDRTGAITKDVAQAVRKIPVATDDATLSTLLAAAEAAGGRVRTRNDHQDDISARAGYAENFRQAGDKVVCDLHLLDSYDDRDLFLEIASRTPELAGLSIDFVPTFEVKGGVALMRVAELTAVDLVDEGAITGDGLFE